MLQCINRIIGLLLVLSGLALSQSTIPTAQLPIGIPDPTMGSALLTLLSTATAGGACHSSAHVWCVPNTAGSNNANGSAFKTAFGNHGDADGASATGNVENEAPHTAEVIVLTHDDGTSNHQYESTGASAPFAVASNGCLGNNSNAYNEGPCNFLLGPVVQPDPANITPIIIVTDHYLSLPGPDQNTRVIPLSGDGISLPAGMVGNVAPSDFATFQSAGTNSLMFLSQNGTNGVRFIGIHFTSTSHSGGHTLFEQGITFQLVRALGAGITGSRALYIKDGSNPTYMSTAIRIQDTDSSVPGPHVNAYPVITETHVVSSTPCTQTWSLAVPLDTPTLVCFTGIGTHWVAGRSTLTLVFNAHDFPASDATVNALASGSGSGQCAAGATNAGNDTEGNLCVVDATHAYTSITIATQSPANGGVHNFYIDTYAAGGGSYTAGTEHSVTDAALLGQYPQAWTLTCTDCPLATSGGISYIPIDSSFHTFVAQGTLSGPGATNWTSTHRLVMGQNGTTTPLTACTALNSPKTGCSAPIVNIGTQTITQVYYAISNQVCAGVPCGAPSVNVTAVVTNGGFNANGVVSTTGETDVLYKVVTSHYNALEAIDHCGPTRNQYNYVSRGAIYTLTCYGKATNWTSALNCSGTCGTTNLNFGYGITINSVSVSSTTQLTINFTVGATAETGAPNTVFDRVWANGFDGQIYNTDTSVPGNLQPCIPTGGSYVLNNCYPVNAIGISQGIMPEGPNNVVINSFVNAIHGFLADSQAIGQIFSCGPTLIKNNFASASTENVFTGGGAGNAYNNALCASSDVEVVGNYLYKPPIWRNVGIGQPTSNCSATSTSPTGSHYGCVWSIKNLWETKGCNRCWIHNNVMENNWVGEVIIYTANVMTSRSANSQGNAASSDNDITFEDNLIVGEHNNMSIAGYDTNAGYSPAMASGFDSVVDNGAMTTAQARRIVVRNNLWVGNQNAINNGNNKTLGVSLVYNRDLLIKNNTMLPVQGVDLNDPSYTNGGLYFNNTVVNNCAAAQATSNNVWALNNVMFRGIGAQNGCGAQQVAANPTTTNSTYADRFQGNVFPLPGNGSMPSTTYYSTLPSSGIPLVTSILPNTYPLLDQSQPFTLDYTLAGPLPDLQNWVGANSNTTDGLTAGVNMTPIIAMARPVMKGVLAMPDILTVSLANGIINHNYTSTLVVSGGTSPYVWSVVSGAMSVCPSLTNNLCLDATTGIISGVPTSSTVMSFTVQVTDANSLSDTQPLTLLVTQGGYVPMHSFLSWPEFMDLFSGGTQ